MKKILLAVVAVMMTALSVNAQVKVESPHPDFDIQITRCANANGTVVLDLIITNFGIDEEIRLGDGDIKMYDDEGNSYDCRNSKFLFGFPNKGLKSGSYPYGFKGGVFPQDIPLKFRIEFGDISSNASMFSLVKVGFTSRGAMALKNDNPLIFRNLEWVK